MARDPNEIRVEGDVDIPIPRSKEGVEPSVGELFKRVTSDSAELIRQEVTLAKVEMRESLSTMAQDATRASIGLGLTLVGVLAFAAFLIAGLGVLFDGRYWLSALIIGVIFLAVGFFLARNALSEMKQHSLVPDQTVESLRRDAAWAKREAKEVKREMTT